jgi:lipopolysaccharide transport system ATP-binding protein
LNRFLARIRGKEDPYLKIGESNDRSTKGTSEYVWALKDINFEVKRGEILGIIGKNGAGKSTLLKILSKVTGPTTGAIKSRGRIASLLEVGTGFHPEMTGKENIFLNGAILGMTKKEIASKLDEIIEFSGCERYVETPVKRYSSGMKVRLAFAVAAFLEPDILVVDEVLAVGDAEFQKKAIGKMQDISNTNGRTVLFVSHDMASIQSLCNRLVVLKDGWCDFIGNVNSGISHYLNQKQQIKSLLNITDRKGNKSAQFASVTFSYHDGENLVENVDEIPSGVKLYIDIGVKNLSQQKRNVNISIKINDCLGIPVTNISNEFTGSKLFLEGDMSFFRYEVFNFDLRANNFMISLYGEDEFGIFDSIENEVFFTVVESDYFGTGRYPKQKVHGYFLLKSKQYMR